MPPVSFSSFMLCWQILFLSFRAHRLRPPFWQQERGARAPTFHQDVVGSSRHQQQQQRAVLLHSENRKETPFANVSSQTWPARREGRVWAQLWLIVVSSLRSNLEPSNQRQSAIASFIFQETHHQEGTTQHAAEAKWLSALFLRALAGFFYYYSSIPVLRYRGFAFRISRQQQQHRHHGGTGYKLQRATQEGARLAWASNKTKNPNRRVARSFGRSLAKKEGRRRRVPLS